MAIKTSWPTLEEVPEPLRGDVEQRDVDGQQRYVLQFDGTPPGLVPKSELDEMRTNNVGLKRSNDRLTQAEKEAREQLALYGDITPEKLKELQEAAKKGEDAIPVDKHQAELKKQVDEAIRPMQERLQTLEQQNKDKDAALDSAKLEGHLIKMPGLREGAQSVAVREAIEDGWRLKDGRPVLLGEDGMPVLSKDKPGEAMGLEEYAASKLKPRMTFLFEASGGGGAPGSGDPKPGPEPAKVIPYSDKKAMSANLEGIANGTVQVDMDK